MTATIEKTPFKGPLFIVGFGRSGTKLLRAILNANTQITIPNVESNVLPMWIMQENRYGDLSVKQNFKRFYANAVNEPFFIHMKQRRNVISLNDWYSGCSKHHVEDVFEVMIKYYSGYTQGQIWGDKSPANTRYISRIKKKFPQSKFIHIVRDVRDCCASAKKAWKSNVYRTAQRWANTVQEARNASFDMRNDYFEIKYEDLIQDPENSIKAICRFLSVAYDKNMLTLNKSTEKFGDAAGSTQIISTNKNKYKEKLTPKEISGIETIARSGLKRHGYVCAFNGPGRPLSKTRMRRYRVQDGAYHIMRNIRDKGVTDAVIFTWKFFRMNTIIGN